MFMHSKMGQQLPRDRMLRLLPWFLTVYVRASTFQSECLIAEFNEA